MLLLLVAGYFTVIIIKILFYLFYLFICFMIFVCVCVQRVLLMDEISTGRDSATTYSVAQFLSNTTHVLGLTTMIGLLQPPPEVYAIFDDVLLLTDG